MTITFPIVSLYFSLLLKIEQGGAITSAVSCQSSKSFLEFNSKLCEESYPNPTHGISFCFTNCTILFHSKQKGVYLCLDCSAAHRSLGVHLTFVRSLDLDEWTQSQIDAMRLGGNGNARSYFRKHGFTDLYGGKSDKLYKSKAAQSYKAELAKLVADAAAKRGEGPAAANSNANGDGDSNGVGNGSLLANLEITDKQSQQNEARMKLQAARSGSSGGSAGILQPKAKLASSLAGASKLLVKPKTGTLGTLRKPTGSSSLLKKKGSLGGSKLRINKLSMKLPVTGSSVGAGDDNFEDIEQTRKNAAEAEAEAKQDAEDIATAKKMQEELM